MTLEQRPFAEARLAGSIPRGNAGEVCQRPNITSRHQNASRVGKVVDVGTAQWAVARPEKVAVCNNPHRPPKLSLVCHAAHIRRPVSLGDVVQQRGVVPRTAAVVKIDRVAGEQRDVTHSCWLSVLRAPALPAKQQVAWLQLVQVGGGDGVQQPPGGVCGMTGRLAEGSGCVVPEKHVVDDCHKILAVQACVVQQLDSVGGLCVSLGWLSVLAVMNHAALAVQRVPLRISVAGTGGLERAPA